MLARCQCRQCQCASCTGRNVLLRDCRYGSDKQTRFHTWYALWGTEVLFAVDSGRWPVSPGGTAERRHTFGGIWGDGQTERKGSGICAWRHENTGNLPYRIIKSKARSGCAVALCSLSRHLSGDYEIAWREMEMFGFDAFCPVEHYRWPDGGICCK